MKTIRAFIAISLPGETQAELGKAAAALAGQLPERSVRWVRSELIHLTLRFLGDTAVAELPDIMAELDRITANHKPFTLFLDELGCFPNRKRPRVIWAGLQGEIAAVKALKREIDAALEPLGWKREKRPFQAHLTIGRVKNSRKLAGIEWGAEMEKLAVPVTAVHLIESQLRPSGPVYTIRHTSHLRGSRQLRTSQP